MFLVNFFHIIYNHYLKSNRPLISFSQLADRKGGALTLMVSLIVKNTFFMTSFFHFIFIFSKTISYVQAATLCCFPPPHSRPLAGEI